MSISASSFILPDTDPSWSFWRSLNASHGEAVASPAECKDGARAVIVGLPATACRSIGLVLPAADKALLPAMVQAQLEKRGITVETTPVPNFAYHILGQTAHNTVVSVDVLVNPFPDAMALNRAANYTAALRLMSLPQGELAVIEEQGLLLLAVNQQGKLWHSHVLGTAESEAADLARELAIAKLSLDAQQGISTVRAVTLVGSKLAALKAELASQSALEINTAPALLPDRTLKVEAFPKLLPQTVREAQSARARRGLYARIGVLVTAIYVVLFVFGWLYLSSLESKAAKLRKDVADTGPQADAVKQTARLWKQLEPAIDVQRYPVVQLSEITELMPPSGVLLKRFEAKPDEIELRGDARDAQTATLFLDDLKKHPKLSRYKWDMPVPSVKDKVASFKIQGKLEGEG